MKKTHSKIWLIADTHFGHSNMVKYCGRPEDFSELILKNLSEMIKPGDTLIHLGDVCFGDEVEWNQRIMNALPGVLKVLVLGNHDRRKPEWYEDHGWNWVTRNYELTFKKRHLWFSHEPIPGMQTLNIHGHFHNNLERLLKKDWVVAGEEERNREVLAGMNGNHKLLAIEYTDYKPVLLEEFLKQNDKKQK